MKLRNAVLLAEVESFFGIIKMKAEANDSYPSENYDWSKSGLYK
jgi:hypothetical protein